MRCTPVFNVANGQKTYFDPQFSRSIPFSSGQQVKRSLLESLSQELRVAPSPTTFLFDVDKQKKLKEGEVYGTCDPSYPDQLFGGWMKAAKGGGEPGSFDRSDRSNNRVIVRGVNGKELTEEEISDLLKVEGNTDRSLGHKWLNPADRATGLFVFDIAIDLRRLFSVSLNSFEPEMADSTIEKLRSEGWDEAENVFGSCLVALQEVRTEWIKGLAKAILNWKITSNQSRTFSFNGNYSYFYQ